MPAFNSRLKPKKIGHMPLSAVLGMLGMLITGVLSIVLPYPFKLVIMILFGTCFLIAGFCFRVGDELPFMSVKFSNDREENRVSPETWTDA